MTRTIAVALLASFAASGAAVAQDDAEAKSPREMMREFRQEIRGEGIDQARFAEFVTSRADARFDHLDADGDGSISREEFAANRENRIERQFARMDRNEDGRITREDRPFRKHMRGERGDRAERSAPETAPQTEQAD